MVTLGYMSWKRFTRPCSISSRLIMGRIFCLPLGSPTMAVPPPHSRITVWPARFMCLSAMRGTRLPTCRLSAVGSKPM